MTEINVESLKDELGDFLTRVRKGERIVFTDQGRSVAVLLSVEDSGGARRAWQLVESGVAHWQGGKPRGSRQRPRVEGKSASEIVLEDRR